MVLTPSEPAAGIPLRRHRFSKVRPITPGVIIAVGRRRAATEAIFRQEFAGIAPENGAQVPLTHRVVAPDSFSCSFDSGRNPAVWRTGASGQEQKSLEAE